MERFQESRENALKNLKVADHILNMTYPLIQDTKLLLGVMDNLFLSLTNAMCAILWYERLYKEVPPFHNNFESKFNMFRYKCVKKHNIEEKYIEMIQEIKETIVLHRKSKVEFRKKDRFVICGEDYSVTAVTVNQLKDYLKKTKEFFVLTNEIVGNDERTLRGSKRRIEAR